MLNGNRLAVFLSMNKTLYEYKKTTEEALILLLREIQRESQSPPDQMNLVQKKIAIARRSREFSKNNRMQKILNSDYVIQMLAFDLLPLGPHFRAHREFTVNWLTKALDVNMGVSTTHFSSYLSNNYIRCMSAL